MVAAPTYFPMSGGTGLMGEAGPEAIMPLRRGSDGRLGVQARAAPLDLAALGQLTFRAPDEERFPATRLCREAAQAGGAVPAVLNAANVLPRSLSGSPVSWRTPALVIDGVVYPDAEPAWRQGFTPAARASLACRHPQGTPTS